MDTTEQLNQAIKFIEEHLLDEIDYAQLSQAAGCSEFHFVRMFPFIAGISLSDYVRRRRLSLAAAELQQSKAKVIDVALKYGYESPTAFNRAFKAVHGIAPKDARLPGIRLKTYPVISFQLRVKGDVHMDYKIIEKPEMQIVGIKRTMPLVDGDEDFAGINELWASLTEDDYERIAQFGDGAIEGIIGVSANNDGKTFDYYIACTAGSPPKDSSLDTLLIPATTWGVFEAVGALPDSIVNKWKRIFAEWFPASGYEILPLPTIEIYSEGDSSADDYSCELWVPISKL